MHWRAYNNRTVPPYGSKDRDQMSRFTECIKVEWLPRQLKMERKRDNSNNSTRNKAA